MTAPVPVDTLQHLLLCLDERFDGAQALGSVLGAPADARKRDRRVVEDDSQLLGSAQRGVLVGGAG